MTLSFSLRMKHYNVDYFGSVGNAFINGILVSDYFCNGSIWEIGIKRHMPRLAEKGMYFHIIPYSVESGVIFDPEIELRHKPGEGMAAEIYSITAIPEYRVVLQINGHTE